MYITEFGRLKTNAVYTGCTLLGYANWLIDDMN